MRLFTKLALTLGGIGLVLSSILTAVLERAHRAFHLEVHQQLFQSLAADLISESATGSASGPEVERLLNRVRQLNITNPGVAAYLVEPTGSIAASSFPPERLRRRAIAMEPVREFIAGPARWPLVGDDPLSDGAKTIFSAARLPDTGKFLYVVLDSSTDGGSTSMFPTRRSYSEREAIWLVLGNVVGGLFAALAAAWFITQPLARLRDAMEAFERSRFEGPLRVIGPRRLFRDEIDRLAEIFHFMAAKIAVQIESLRRADDSRRELFAELSHDMRTPLTAVRGYVERLATRPDLADADRERYFGIVGRHIGELDRLIGQILEMAKLESPQIRARAAELRLDRLVREVVDELRPAMDEKQLQVQLQLPASNVLADDGLVRRAVGNLLDNAVRESPAGSTVELALAPLADGAWEFSVADRGSGISEENSDRIFHRFYRGAGGETVEARGAGLGLAIVRRIAELHGGTVTAERRPGGGAVFRLVLPAGGDHRSGG